MEQKDLTGRTIFVIALLCATFLALAYMVTSCARDPNSASAIRRPGV